MMMMTTMSRKLKQARPEFSLGLASSHVAWKAARIRGGRKRAYEVEVGGDRNFELMLTPVCLLS